MMGLFGISMVCGLVDAACFLALGGVFAEVMTGNLVLLAFRLGSGEDIPGGSTARYLAAVAFFAVGALLGGLMLRGPSRVADHRFGFLAELALLVAATATAIVTGAGYTGWNRDVVVALLATAMGIQNALLRAHGVRDLATNVMTLTFTALVADSTLARGTNVRWLRRTCSIVTFFCGAALGARLVRYGAHYPLILATVVFSLALIPLLGSSPTEPGPAAASATARRTSGRDAVRPATASRDPN